MKFHGVKGMRDFYPEDMAVRNWLMDLWRRVSLRNGFEEFDGPILETLDLYTAKSGNELVGQLFRLTDGKKRELAIRPEITPTLARMINARVHSLPRPIKWFSVPRVCRGETPQAGRLREFFQWNIDIVGIDDVLADAESIFVAIDLLREAGLAPTECMVCINSRRLVASLLADLRVPAERMDTAYAILDKAAKIPAEALAEMWGNAFGAAVPFAAVEPLLHVTGLDHLRELLDRKPDGWSAARRELPELERLFDALATLGVADYCVFDMSVVRGLAYYTGVVYEAYDRAKKHRAICGGGRYDDLLRALGGPEMPGVGFGMGDVVILDVLREAARLPTIGRRLDVFVVHADAESQKRALELVARLRQGGFAADFSYRAQAIGKQLRAASDRGAVRAVIVGDETRSRNVVTVKDLTTGRQVCRDWDDFLQRPMAPIE